MTVGTDLARLAVGTAVLAFASWTDWRWRRAPNALWVFVAAVGLALLLLDLVLEPAATLARAPYLLAAPLFAALVWGAWRAHLIAGGADAKALMSIAVLTPFPLDLGHLPLVASAMPASFAVLGNSMLAFLAVPLAFAAWNLVHGELRFPHLFLGSTVALDALGRGHAWPMERVEEGRVRTTWFAHRRSVDVDELRGALAAAGRTRTWVTPKVPFMLPLLAGFVGAFVVGDVLTWLVARLVA